MEKGDTDFATVIRTRTGLNAINPTLIRFYWQEMLEAVKEIHDKSNNFFFVLFLFSP
jgi:serine/threonine-protein kinase TTK/MPS1